MSKEVILTGIRANGELHLGNYLGAILPMVDLQAKHKADKQINMFVADMHSFTTPVEFTSLAPHILSNLKTYVAAGLDIDNADTYIYRQSRIGLHAEAAWYLSCFTGYGESQRMTEFKDKADRLESVTMGLLNYPVLMAADILLYSASYVPVGEDQRQHLELCRTIAERMNSRFAETFPDGLLHIPYETKKQLEFCDRDQAPRVRSLQNPDKKMSKSIDDPRGTILLSDNPDEAAKKVMSATTDSFGEIKFDMQTRPGIGNLLQILALLSNQNLRDVLSEWDGKSSYGDLKTAVAEVVKSFLTNFQQKLASVDEAKLLIKLESEETAMTKVAKAKLLQIQQAVGLRT